MKKTIVFDLDGCLIWDFGEYETEDFKFTPLIVNLKSLGKRVRLVAVTGRTVVPERVAELFDEVITRPFPVEPMDTFMERYHKWKCETISAIDPILAYDDNEAVANWLNENGIETVLVTAYKE